MSFYPWRPLDRAVGESSASMSPAQARFAIGNILEDPVRLDRYGRRATALHALGEVARGRVAVPLHALTAQLFRYADLLVPRPDGHVVKALTDRVVTHLVRVPHGATAWWSGRLRVGCFYRRNQCGALLPVDEELRLASA